MNTIDSASPSWTRSELSHDQVVQWTKAKVRVYPDSALCLGRMNDGKDAISRWEGQIKELKTSPCYKELLGIDGEAIELEWNKLPGYSSLQILQEIQNDSQRRNIKPEKFTDPIIFMSSFNDIDWTQKKEMMEFAIRTQKESRKTRRDLGPGEAKKWYGTLFYTPEGKWDSTAGTNQRCRSSTCALSRGTLKNSRDTTRFNADASNTELLLRITHSVEQIDLTEEEKGKERQKESVTKNVLSTANYYEVKLLVSPRNVASGNSLRENTQDSESLTETAQFTRVCELAAFRCQLG